jgi:hypothetical protein
VIKIKEIKQDLKDEFKINQNIILKWDRYSLYIKNWAVSTWFLVLIFILTQYYSSEATNFNIIPFFVILGFLLFPFWAFDALFKRFQRMTVARSGAITDYLNGNLKDKEDTFLTLSDNEKNEIKKKLKQKNESVITDEDIKTEIERFIMKFPVYDPVGGLSLKNSFYRVRYFKIASLWRSATVRVVSTIYLILFVLLFIIISIVTSICWISLFSLIPGIPLFLSWLYCQREKI